MASLASCSKGEAANHLGVRALLHYYDTPKLTLDPFVLCSYKILFLDVLFPLELDRVIFVDSDQIVRADLKELIDLDLKGAPYAYTPMGNDREETKGFRFWDSGYWKEHLKGAPYHIR